MKTCLECGAVYLGKKINHWEHCSKWNGIKGRIVKVSTVHIDKEVKKKLIKEV